MVGLVYFLSSTFAARNEVMSSGNSKSARYYVPLCPFLEEIATTDLVHNLHRTPTNDERQKLRIPSRHRCS